LHLAIEDVFLATPATAHVPVLSSLAGAMRSYIESKFPKGYFLDVNVSTETPQPSAGLGAGRSSRRRWGRLKMSNIDRPKLPMLSIRVDPTIDSSEFSSGTSWYKQNLYASHPGDMRRVLQDDQDLRWIGVHDERMICRFQISFVVESDLKAFELARHLKNVFPLGQRAYLNEVLLAAEIPAEILRHVWHDMELDPSSQEDRDRFDRYIRSYTDGFAERTVKGASGRMAFGYRYRANPLLTMEEPNVNVERNGNVVSSATVDVQAVLDVPFPATFGYKQEAALSGTNPPLDRVDILQESGKIYLETAIVARPSVNADEYLRLMFFVGLVSTEDRTFTQDVTEMAEQAPPSLKAYVEHLATKPDFSALFKPMLFRDSLPLPVQDFEFDHETWTLTIRQSGLRYNYKYHLGIYCDMGEYARLGFRPAGPLSAPSPYDKD